MNAPVSPGPTRLTSFSHGGGCGCKIAPGVLSEILKGSSQLPLPPEWRDDFTCGEPNNFSLGLVFFAVGSSVVVSLKTSPAFVLVWLLSFYVLIGLIETMIALPGNIARRRRGMPLETE